jgi:LysM repeat protein
VAEQDGHYQRADTWKKEGSTPVPQYPDNEGFDAAFNEQPYDSEYELYQERQEPHASLDEPGNGRSVPRALMKGGSEPDVRLAPFTATPADAPVLISGSGVSMGTPFIKRRQRPLSMRLAMVIILTCMLLTALISAVPLSLNNGNSYSGFQVLAGAVVSNQTVSYQWYVAQSGDDLEIVSARFHVQIGGILELNSLPPGQELQIGKAYKIPDDAN